MRYIGNKNKLLPDIDKFIKSLNLDKKGLTFCDIFAGTGTVSAFYNGFYKIIANDFLDSTFNICNAKLSRSKPNFNKLKFEPLNFFNNHDCSAYSKGFAFNNFSPNGGCMYFTDENAKRIDFIRDTIDEWYIQKKISDLEKSYLIACLLEAVSKVSNVAGVYSAFLRKWDPRASKKLVLEPIEKVTTHYTNFVYCRDSGDLINDIKGDILYLDPPYTTTQYNSQYHVLETIARNDKPKTHGVGKHRDNDRMSNWSKKGLAEFELVRLIKNAQFTHIILSYSDKGIIDLDFIKKALKRYAEPNTFVFKKIPFYKYKSSRAIKKEQATMSANKVHYEYLFYIKKCEKPLYHSPINYIGGKYEALEFIKNNSPRKIDTFYDLFGGGATVAINVKSKNIIYNDINCYLVDLLRFLSTTHPFEIYKSINKLIKKYKLEKGYKAGYMKLRECYNNNKNPLMLYLLICYGFEHQIRFNSSFQFNNPCGNSSFSSSLYEKLISFYLRCQEINIKFTCTDYGSFHDFKNNDLVYLDPPYYGNNGCYQDGKRGFNGWSCSEEERLRKFILKLKSDNIRVLLSNYANHTSCGKNDLIDWANENDLKCIVDNHLTRRNRQSRVEVLCSTYEKG